MHAEAQGMLRTILIGPRLAYVESPMDMTLEVLKGARVRPDDPRIRVIPTVWTR